MTRKNQPPNLIELLLQSMAQPDLMLIMLQ